MDNGGYAKQLFRGAVKYLNQKITFCAVGAHHQNIIAKSRIKIPTLGARTLLFHPQRHFPEAITAMLCPLVLLEVAEYHNVLNIDVEGKNPLENFSGVKGDVWIKLFHTWGCLVYVLDSRLQDVKLKLPKWHPRTRAGIYIGRSTVHSNSVSLIFNTNTIHVSPQLHCVFIKILPLYHT